MPTYHVISFTKSEAVGLTRKNAPSASTRSSRPVQNLLTFNWKAYDKYKKLLNFEFEVKNILRTKSYDIQGGERVPVIMNWLGGKELHFMQSLPDNQQGICKSSACLFSIHNK